jgi:hypothetical protein
MLANNILFQHYLKLTPRAVISHFLQYTVPIAPLDVHTFRILL